MIDRNLALQFANGFRFQWEAMQDSYVLLYPEGMVKLHGSAGEILGLVGESRSTADIVATLQKKFPSVDSLEAEVNQFIEEALANGWLTFE